MTQKTDTVHLGNRYTSLRKPIHFTLKQLRFAQFLECVVKIFNSQDYS